VTRPGDSRLERLIGLVLKIGVLTSTACLALGSLLDLMGAAGLGHVFMTIGFVVLLGTPVSRVGISLLEYAMERDWVFVALTLIVFMELASSLLVAFR
jgi:uncharacterized membrane protein